MTYNFHVDPKCQCSVCENKSYVNDKGVTVYIKNVPRWWVQHHADTKRFRAAWDYGCVAFDAWLQGFRFAQREALDFIGCQINPISYADLQTAVAEDKVGLATELVPFEYTEVREFKNGKAGAEPGGLFVGYINSEEDAKREMKNIRKWLKEKKESV